jgi:hypothetical protein
MITVEIGIIDILLIWATMALIWHLGRRSVFDDINRILKDSDEDQEPALEALEIVKDEQGWFSYNSRGEFVAWAPELVDMFEQISQRHPGKVWKIDGPQLSELAGENTEALISKISQHFSQR